MFKVVSNLTFWWPVKVLEPDPDRPGKLQEQEFEAEFRLIDRAETKASAEARRQIMARVSPDLDEATLKAVADELEAHDKAAVRRVLVGWRNVVDDKGNPIAFDEKTFAALYDMDRVRAAFNRAYGEAIAEDKARLGN
ncbi:phage tail assembly chaperone [Pleomorphomonas koreensis]|uniref:phage tail assembly chaperone n=1 Tax=Pleomorphomonas koreensis TaxID=257440 RepID=UPI000407240F|nr:phage tail assembly chaperone [Pleomorphomonas koreensis]